MVSPLALGLGEVAGKVFRIGHLGSLTDVMMLSGLATAEMCMVDLGLDIELGSGVAAAQEYYRHGPAYSGKRSVKEMHLTCTFQPTTTCCDWRMSGSNLI